MSHLIGLNKYIHTYIHTVALRKLEKSSSSKEVREKARGALFKLENRDQQQNRPKSAKPGRYRYELNAVQFCNFILTITRTADAKKTPDKIN